VELAELVAAQCGGTLNYCYELEQPIEAKINAIVRRLYGGVRAELSPEAKKQAKRLAELGFGNLPVCMAKTQYSFSDKPTLLCAPEGFEVSVKSLRVSAGAGFVVALTGDIMTMPGLPKSPAAERIDVDEDGRITGLF
jgi:formate--tetrahydrofolate ligase